MTDKRKYRKRNEDKLVRTVFSNTVETRFNPIKNYYGIIEDSGKNHISLYEGKHRSEATIFFEEVARLQGGKLTHVGVLK